MQHSETLHELAKALAAAQADMKAAEMNATNPFLKNRYADLGSIIEAVRPAIGKHGLSFSQLPSFDGTTVTVETVMLHASGEWLASTMTLNIEGEKGLSLAQVMGKAITYLRRYGLSAMFGVYADKDEDGNGDGGESTAHHAAPSKAASVTPGEAQNCPKCGGPTWDNRAKKASGEFAANRPDFSCKNKECGGAVWPPKDDKPVAEPSEQPKVQAPPNGNGDNKPRLAVIRTPNFAAYAKPFAEAYPSYRSKSGTFDAGHIQASLAVNCKVYEVTDANIADAFDKLKAHAEEQAQLPA